MISPDIGGGFGNKVPVYPGYVCAIVGAIVTGRPVKWMEDRSENLMSTGFARDYVMRGAIAATADGKILAVRVDVLADHGAFNADRPADQLPGRLLPRVHRLLRPRGGLLPRPRRLHQQGPRRRRIRVLVPDCRGRVPGRAARRLPRARTARSTPRELRLQNLIRRRPVPLPVQDRLGLRLGRLRAGARARRSRSPAMRSSVREQAERRERGELMGDRARRSSPRRSAPVRASTWTSSGSG